MDVLFPLLATLRQQSAPQLSVTLYGISVDILLLVEPLCPPSL